MFHKGKAHPDIKKTTQRFIDPKKESQSRLRALRTLLDYFDPSDSRIFFKSHYSEIFYVFHDVFSMVETNLKTKGHKSQAGDLDSVLFILERILRYLPELIQKRWQFNSIARVMRKLLHRGNVLKLRREGVRLFMLWFQALQDNSDELCQLIYACLIPGFPNPVDGLDWSKNKLSKACAEEIYLSIGDMASRDLLSSTSNMHLLSADGESEDWCFSDEVGPVLPANPSERILPPETLTKFFLDRVLDCMSTQLVQIEWTDRRSREHAFYFLFENFKRFYLPHIFQDWNPSRLLYQSNPAAQVPCSRPKKSESKMSMTSARDSVLRWFVAFTVRFKRSNSTSESLLAVNQSEVSSTSTESIEPGSPDSVKFSLARNREYLQDASEVIRKVLYSTKANIRLLHEVLRQAFRLPAKHLSTIRQVLLVYHEWLKSPERPIFMLEPDQGVFPSLSVEESNYSPQSPIRTFSYSYAVDKERERAFRLPCEDVRAGLQANLRLFILHAAAVFLVEDEKEYLDKQVDVCKRVVHLYRSIVLEVPMESTTWEQMLEALLEASRHLLVPDKSQNKAREIARQTAGSLLQTLFVTWIRANLKVNVPIYLWDKCLEVISSATHWEEIISEWSVTMETLTRVMARTVYGLDMADLPLERLTEQKRKRRPNLQQERLQFTKSSFSRWSRLEKSNGPKQIMPQVDKTIHSEKHEQSMSPKTQRPFVSSQEGGQVSSSSSPKHPEVKVFPTANSTFFPSSTAEDKVSPFRKVASSPVFTAGTVTRKDAEAAGQLQPSKDANKESKESSTEEPKVSFTLASDTDSVESLDMPSRADEDAGAMANEDSENMPDGRFRQRLNRLSSSDSYLSSQDNMKSMAWYGSSLDFDVSPCSKYAPGSESPKMLGKIDESSLESKLEDLQLSQHRPVYRTSTPSRDARLGEGEEGVLQPLTTVKEEFNHDTGGRSSAESSGRATPDILAPGSRSPSPEPHLEETHEGLLDDDFVGDDSHEEDTSVVAGGYREGWGPVAAVVLWRRMLGILGNVNKIKDPAIHAKVFECLTAIWNMLAKIRLNQGISLDNKSTPPIPVLLPPLQHMATWVFESLIRFVDYQKYKHVTKVAASLSINNEFKSGRLLAYKLMCAMTVSRQDMPLSQEYLTHFYRLMHIGLTGTDQNVTSAIISSCANFFSVMLPSSSLLILDFIQATNGVVNSQNMELPREEAVTLIGSLLCFPNNVANMPLHQPGHQTNEYQPKSTCKDVKDKLISSLLRASKLDPSCSARCIALNALGVFIAEELIHCQGHPKVHECLCVLLASITFHNRSVCHVACGVIHLLSEYYKELVAFEKDLPLKIVEVLCHAIVNLLPGGESAQIQEQHKVLASVLMCLLDWLMVIPVSKLLSKTNEDENVTLLARVFQVLKMAAANKGPKKRTKQLNISTIISGDGRPIRLARIQEENRSSSAGPSSPVDSLTDIGGDVQEDDPGGQDMFDFPPKSDSVELTAKAVLMHIVNHIGHYPLGAGPSRVDSLISEHEDNPNVDTDELSASIFNAPNVQFFVLNDSVLISLVELPLEDSVAQEVPASTAATQVRVITRDMTGKNVWDYTLLHGSLQGENEDYQASVKTPDLSDDIPTQEDGGREGSDVSYHPLSKFKKCSTPVAEDRLDDLLCGIGVSSRECLLYPDHAPNEPGPCPENVLSDMEYDVIDSVLEQDASVKKRVENDMDDPSLSSLASSPPPYGIPVSPFQLSRFVVSQNGMMTSEKRTKIDLLKKTDRFLRELKNLDNRRCRETHKIALVYVAHGQEDKTSIMSNCVGSVEFEHFVAGLAWEVDLSKHTGFLGGLEKNLSTGTTAPYYCNSTTEVMFHVSTRMPLATDNTGFNRKVRHIGNDEVHIVWSEHYRDYRHGIVNTDFAHVMIVIYPLRNHLFRIQIIKKPKVPMFGPLFDGALVDRKVLPTLVRATAINASRATRELLPVYERYFEERAACIERIVKNHKEPTTYEDFASLVFCPVPKPPGSEPPTPTLSAGERHLILRTETAPTTSSLSDSEKTSLRNRSKSVVTSPRLFNNKLVVEEEFASLTSSLPDGLDNVTGGQAGTDGTNPRQDRKRLSLRWRNKLASQGATGNAADSE